MAFADRHTRTDYIDFGDKNERKGRERSIRWRKWAVDKTKVDGPKEMKKLAVYLKNRLIHHQVQGPSTFQLKIAYFLFGPPSFKTAHFRQTVHFCKSPTSL